MTAYEFRLRMGFPKESFIAETAKSVCVTVPPGDQLIILRSCAGTNLIGTQCCDAIAAGFPTLEQATHCGRSTREALAVCCGLLGMGVQIGEHEEFFKALECDTGVSDERAIAPSSMEGLLVYPEGSRVKGLALATSVSAGPRGERFGQMLVRSFRLRQNLDSGLRLAFELYNSHRFEVSLRARFLQLFTTVECLARQGVRHEAIVTYVEDLVRMSKMLLPTAGDAPKCDWSEFIRGLQQLKQETKASACRRMIRAWVGSEAVACFKLCSRLRNQLVHEGRAPAEAELRDRYVELDDITRRLLYAMLTAGADEPTEAH